MIRIEKENESFLKITGDYEDMIGVSEHFTRYAPNYIWNPRYKAGVWDGKIRFFNMLTGLLPYGLKDMLTDYLILNQVSYEWDERGYTKLKWREDIFQEVLNEFKIFKLNKHQIRGARKILEEGKGLLEHATSSGKTATLFIVINYYLKIAEHLKMIVVVPNKGLIKQFYANFVEYGMDLNLLGKYFQDEKDLTKRITVGTWQSLRKVTNFLREVSIVIGDEIHQAKAVEIKKLFEECTNAFVRVGVTGSLYTDECDQLSVIGSFGRVLDVVKTDELIKADIVSPVEIVQIHLYYNKEITKSCRKDYHLEREIIQNDSKRMLLVRKLIERQNEKDNLLLLFDTLEFGERYFEYLKAEFPNRKFKYVSGEVSADEREEIRTFANDNESVVIVASLGTYSTGIDIPRLHTIIFLWMGKSDVRLKQSIGRGLRKHATKNKIIIYDICDQLKYSKGHAGERLRVYMEEGYPVKSIEVGKQQ